jgi:hypothetical protein
MSLASTRLPFSLDILIFPPTSIPLSGYASKPSRPYRPCAIWVSSGSLSQHVHCAGWINNSVLELCLPPLFIITNKKIRKIVPNSTMLSMRESVGGILLVLAPIIGLSLSLRTLFLYIFYCNAGFGLLISFPLEPSKWNEA